MLLNNESYIRCHGFNFMEVYAYIITKLVTLGFPMSKSTEYPQSYECHDEYGIEDYSITIAFLLDVLPINIHTRIKWSIYLSIHHTVTDTYPWPYVIYKIVTEFCCVFVGKTSSKSIKVIFNFTLVLHPHMAKLHSLYVMVFTWLKISFHCPIYIMHKRNTWDRN